MKDKIFMIAKLFKEKTDNINIQIFRYVFVGGLAYVVDFGSLFVFTEFFRVYYLTSAALAFLLGSITNYILSTIWVFNKRTLKNKWFEFGIFALIGIVGLGLNQFFMYYFTEHIHLHYLFSKCISAVIVFSWNFFARRFILFR